MKNTNNKFTDASNIANNKVIRFHLLSYLIDPYKIEKNLI